MASFTEILQQFKEPGEEGLRDTIYDDLVAAHTEEISIREEKINQESSRVQEYESEISRLKAANYDLLTSAGNSTGDQGGDGSGNEPDEDDGSVTGGTDELFEYEDK